MGYTILTRLQLCEIPVLDFSGSGNNHHNFWGQVLTRTPSPPMDWDGTSAILLKLQIGSLEDSTHGRSIKKGWMWNGRAYLTYRVA